MGRRTALYTVRGFLFFVAGVLDPCSGYFSGFGSDSVNGKLFKMMHTMSEHAGGAPGLGVSVLPFDGMGLYEQRRPRLMFKVPRVVLDQKGKFETDELFRRLSRESEASIKICLLFSSAFLH